MSLLVRGTVVELVENSGSFNDGKAWATRHIVVGYGVDTERVKLPRDMACPDDGTEVEVKVAPNLKQQANNLLAPFRLELVATDWSEIDSGLRAVSGL